MTLSVGINYRIAGSFPQNRSVGVGKDIQNLKVLLKNSFKCEVFTPDMLDNNHEALIVVFDKLLRLSQDKAKSNNLIKHLGQIFSQQKCDEIKQIAESMRKHKSKLRYSDVFLCCKQKLELCGNKISKKLNLFELYNNVDVVLNTSPDELNEDRLLSDVDWMQLLGDLRKDDLFIEDESSGIDCGRGADRRPLISSSNVECTEHESDIVSDADIMSLLDDLQNDDGGESNVMDYDSDVGTSSSMRACIQKERDIIGALNFDVSSEYRKKNGWTNHSFKDQFTQPPFRGQHVQYPWSGEYVQNLYRGQFVQPPYIGQYVHHPWYGQFVPNPFALEGSFDFSESEFIDFERYLLTAIRSQKID
tara:strand:- start:409 stop:1491 length:1083 start_codon:yes stop_codon:yes gene_type:complete